MAAFGTQLRALLRKNLILKKRHWLRTLFEALLPAVIMMVLAWLSTQDATGHIEPLKLSPKEWPRVSVLNTVLDISSRNGFIALIPGSRLRVLQEALNRVAWPQPTILFETEKELDKYLRSSAYRQDGRRLRAAIIGHSVDFPKLHFTLRMSTTNFRDAADTRLPVVDQFGAGDLDAYDRVSSFTELQHFIERVYLREYGAFNFDGWWDMDMDVQMLPFPVDAHYVDSFGGRIGMFLGIFFTIVFLLPVKTVVASLVEEKERRVRELMKMMGTSAQALLLSWWVVYAVMFAFTSALIAGSTATTLYRHSNPFLVFLFFFSFCMAAFSLAFLISAFFDRARVAATVAALVFFATFFVYYTVEDFSVSQDVKRLACLSPAACLSLGASVLSRLEAEGIGINFDTLTTSVQNFAFGDAILMLLIDAGLFILLGMYLEQVLPSAYGTRRVWYFPFTKRYWCPNRSAASPSGLPSDSLLLHELANGTSDAASPAASSVTSPVASPRSRAVRADRFEAPDAATLARPRLVSLRGLTKEWPRAAAVGGTFRAVNEVDIDMYEGQIFSLLGHNGAGKTTLINMLTGMTDVTAGAASLLGLDLQTQMPQIRQSMGVCPQHDVLYPDLSVAEHLHLYAAIKGVPPEQRAEQVQSVIDKVGLGLAGDNKADALSKTLSGGQMRKLSVGMALIGDSKVVFLDEPSSGMDVSAQRHIWSMLLKNKAGRVIVLTTHSMEEAELGDRIGIMARGQLQCVGSSLFLKEAYGAGYTLTISKETSAQLPDSSGAVVPLVASPEALSRSIRMYMAEHFPFAEVLSDAGGEISFRCPFSSASEFPTLLAALDRDKVRVGVRSFGVSVTTLTEVFLRAGKMDGADEEEQAAGAAAEGHGGNELESADAASPLQISESYVPPSASTINAAPSRPSLKSTKQDSAADEEDNAAGEAALFRPLSLSPNTARVCLSHTAALCVKRVHSSKRDKKQWLWSLVYPAVIVLANLLAIKYALQAEYPARTINMGLYPQPSRVPRNSQPTGLIAELDPLFNVLALDSADLGGVDAPFPNFTPGPIESISFNKYLYDTRNDSPVPRYGALWFRKAKDLPFTTGGMPKSELSVNVHFNTTSREAAPAMMNYLTNSILRATALKRGDFSHPSITITSRPLPRTGDVASFSNASIAFAIALAFAFVPAVAVSYIVKERADKVKHLHLISGVSAGAYWLSSWLWDLFNFLFPIVFTVGVLFLLPTEATQASETVLAIALILILSASAVLPFSYAISFFFLDNTVAQTVMLLLGFATSVLLLIVASVLRMIPLTHNTGTALRYAFRLLPPFCLADGIFSLLTRKLKLVFPDGEPKIFELDCIGLDLIFLLVDILLYACVVGLFEHWSANNTFAWLTRKMEAARTDEAKENAATDQQKQDPDESSSQPLLSADQTEPATTAPAVPEDADVALERSRVEWGYAARDSIILYHLRKAYAGLTGRTHVAVKDLSFAIPSGECFGFLGANGAGKTTTIKMLTGDVASTSGTAYLGGLDIQKAPQEVRRMTGYCPQFDALLEFLTAREHLTLYARIKQVPSEDVPGLVNALLRRLGLTELADVAAGTFSGGNKRKLSVGIALIGNPPIVFLDEPSTGMDPAARRGMWNLIQSTMRNRSVILTTHSMEECEALCDRIGIMVGGRLVCLGTSQHLKHRFGSGYQVDLVARDGQADAVHALVHHEFGAASSSSSSAGPDSGVHLLEQHGNSIKYRVPRASTSLPVLFRTLEAAKARGLLATYAASDTTLEQVFISFVRADEAAKAAKAAGRAGSDASHDPSPLGGPQPDAGSYLGYRAPAAGATPALTHEAGTV